MKKITLWLFALFSCWQMSAQVSSYSFVESTETYAQITGTTSTAVGDDGEENAIPIGFNFVFGGTSYSTFSISTNGIIKLGGTIVDEVDNHWTNTLTNGTQVNKPFIAPFWDDNHLSTGEIRYSLTGTAPNQVLSINWHNTKIGSTGSTAGAAVSTILRLYESTNVIEMVYSSPFTTTNTVSASVGLNDMTSFLSITPATTSTVSSTTANNTINATVMANLAGKKFTFTPPTCFIPSGLVSANVTAYTADISWEEPSSGSTEGYEYVLSTTNTVPSGAGTPTSDVFLLFNTLTPQTTYYFFVRSNCGVDGFSNWTSTSFTTSCLAVSVFPFVETFNTDSTSKACWTVIDGNGDGNLWNLNGTIIPRTGQSAQLYTDGNTSNNDYLITPQLDLGANPKRLKFWVRHRSNGEPENLNVRISTTGRAIADFNTVLLTLSTTQLTTTYTEYVVDLTDYVDTPVYIAFAREDAPANGWYLAIDDVTVEDQPLCPDQTGLAVANVTSSEADASWDDMSANGASGYEYAITTSATPPASGTATTLTYYEASGLTPQTVHYLHVRATCDGGSFGNWATISFTTPCSAVSVFPFVETFNTDSTSKACWTVIDGNGDGNLWNLNGTIIPRTGQSAQLYTDVSTSNNDYLITPQLDLGANPKRLKFWVRHRSNGEPENLNVRISTTGRAIADFSTVLLTLSITQLTTTYTEYVVDLTDYVDTPVYIAFAREDAPANGWYLAIDDVTVEDQPLCPDQTGLIVANVTAFGVDTSWDDMSANGASGYEYAITTSATPPASGTATTLTYYEASDLDPQTQYYLHVRATCDGGNFGNWATSASFTTDCAPITSLPHLETFTTFMPACWLRGTNGDLASGPTAFGTSTWVADGPGNVGTTGAIRVNLDATGGNDWIISPMFEIPATGYELRFEVSAHQWNSTGAPTTPWEDSDIVEVLVSSGTANWTVLYTYDSSNVPSNVPTFNTPIDLSAYANQTVRFAFRAFEGLDNERDIEFIVDNFEIRETPACSDQTGLVIGNISATGAEMSWDDMNVDGYEYAVTTSATPPLSGTFTTATFYEAIGNLDPLTVYYLHVRTDCGNGNFGVWVSTSFKTECLPPNITGTTPGAVCGQGSVELSATADAGTIAWYAAQTGGPKLGEGGTFTTPQITTTTSYWVETKTGDTSVLGPISPTAQGGTIGNQTVAWNVNFTVNESTTLTSIDIFPATSGQTGNIQLRQGSGTTVIATVPYTTSVSGGATAQTVELNFELEPGTYNLYPTLPTGGLSRNISGAVYPYSSTVASITGNGYDNAYFMGFYNWVFGTGCASPRTEVVATVTTAQPVTLSSTDEAVCRTETTDLITLTSDVANYDVYSWSPSESVAGDAVTGWTFTPDTTTTYTLTSTQSNGSECVTTTTFNVIVNETPSDIIASDYDVCEGSVIELSIEGGTLINEAVIGTGTVFTEINNLTPSAFNNRYEIAKVQTIYTVSELQAAGFVAGKIESIAYNIDSHGSAIDNSNYTVKIGHYGSESTFTTATFVDDSNFTTCFGPTTYTRQADVLGWYVLEFDNSFIWDGQSNIIIQLSMGGVDTTNNAGTQFTSVPNSVLSGVSTSQTMGTPTIRAEKFNVKMVAQTPVDVVWSPNTNLFTDSAATTAYTGTPVGSVYFNSSNTGQYMYTATASSTAGCSISGTITVNVNDTPDAPNALSPQTLNEGQTLADLTVTAIGDLTWYSDAGLTNQVSPTTEVVDGTTYYVTQTVGSCTSDATPITVDVNLGNGNFDNVTFKVYPNPTKNILNISCNQDISTIEVYNMVGQRVNNMVLNANAGQIDMSNLASGAYFVKVTSNNATKTVKVIKE